ncbi:MAG: ligase-associated DNA damage response endonuclease PdeM [Pirellula sp.]|nr:ligase-associated DNA damage response endonuclease PdeM [Pirellula sp.]
MDRSSGCHIEFAGVKLDLRSTGTVVWSATKTLLLSDLHLGKEYAFQRSSIPIPSGSTRKTLARWSQELILHKVDRCIVLGDLIHSRIAHSDALQGDFDAFWEKHSNVEFLLVLGNHDTYSRKWIERWSWGWIGEEWRESGFCFVHDPFERQNDTGGSERASSNFDREPARLGGHWHPLVKLRDNGEKLKCFFEHQRSFVLPSFGELTFGRGISREPGDRVWGICGAEVVEIPASMTAPQS